VNQTIQRVARGSVIVVVAAAFAAWAFWPRAVEVDLQSAERGAVVVTVAEEGETRVRDRFVISAPVAGTLLRVELDPGDPVVAEETVVAVLQPRQSTPLDPRSLAEAEAEVRAREAELQQARHAEESSEAEFQFARRECDRARTLADRAIVSVESLDLAELDEQRALESLSSKREAVLAAEHRLTAAQARLLNLGEPTRRMDAALEIRSPIDGVVLTRERQSESVIEAGSAILEVGDPNELEIVVEYLSSDAVKMRPGARAFIEGWGGERPLDARIRRIHPSGFTKTSALGVEEQRVRVILDLVSPASEHGRIGDGFRVDVRVVLAQCDDSIRVPIGSLFRVGEQWAVFVLDGGRARKRLVEVGARTMDVAEVLTGIDVGEQVIVYPSNDVSDGTRVVLRSRSL